MDGFEVRYLVHLYISRLRYVQTPKLRLGHKPMLYFALELFDTRPRHIQGPHC